MHTSSHTIRRLAAAIALAAALAALAVPAALAGGHARTLSDGRSPDTRDAATSQSIPRVGNGVFGPAVPTPSGSVTIGPKADGRSPDTRDAHFQAPLQGRLDGRSPDTLDAAITASIAAHQTPTPPSDGRSPDTADAALLAHSPVLTLTKPSGFAWREFGIGAAAATAAILLLLGLRAGLPAARERRELARPPASA